MGGVPSQFDIPKLKIVNKLPERQDKSSEEQNVDTPTASGSIEGALVKEHTEPKIIVSIANKSTVVISEGRSIATQTDNDEGEHARHMFAIAPENTFEIVTVSKPKLPEQTANDAEAGIQTPENKSGEPEPEEAWVESEAFSANETLNEETDIDIKGDDDNETPLPSSSAKVIPLELKKLENKSPIPFEEMELSRYGKYKVRMSGDKEKCIISATTFLETGDAICIDRSNQKIKFVDAKFQYISAHDLENKPWAVCARGTDVFVTMGNTKIKHFTVVDMIMEAGSVFEIKGRCLGICVYGEHLAVGLQIGEICLLTTSGEVIGTIGPLPSTRQGKPCNPWHLSVSKENNLLVTDSDASIVFCINRKSEVIFSYTDMSSPRAAEIDKAGNIVIVGRDQDTEAVVIVLPRDMELQRMLYVDQLPVTCQAKKLVTWEQLEFVPYCVCIRATDNVVVLGGIQESLKIMEIVSASPTTRSVDSL